MRLEVGRSSIPLQPGKMLFACHINNNGDYNSTVGKIVKEKKLFGAFKRTENLLIRNMSDEPWYLLCGDTPRRLDTGAVAALEEGMTLQFGAITGRIITG
jgi:hypothetical protein